jgi:predicted RNase H-like nuclease (RuvC/YqgF family)
MDEIYLSEIYKRVIDGTPGPWEINSLGSKNYLMWFGGNWPEKDDDANYEFMSHAKQDMKYLLDEYKKISDINNENQEYIKILKNQIEKLEEEIKELKHNLG